MGRRARGKELWCLIGAGDAYSRGPIWDAMGNRGEGCTLLAGDTMVLAKHSSNMGAKGDLPHSGDVYRTPSADLGKSRWGFAIMHPYQYGVKRG